MHPTCHVIFLPRPGILLLYLLALFNTPAMQNLMQQISENPSMMQNMMNAPYMQSMMRSMADNPDLAMQVKSITVFAGV